MPLAITIGSQALGASTIPLVDGIAGQPYAASLYAVGCKPPLNWFVDPTYGLALATSGLSIDRAGGIVRGTINPSMSGQTIQFRVVVQDHVGATAISEPGKQIYTINVR